MGFSQEWSQKGSGACHDMTSHGLHADSLATSSDPFQHLSDLGLQPLVLNLWGVECGCD